MTTFGRSITLLLALLAGGCASTGAGGAAVGTDSADGWRDRFDVPRSRLRAEGAGRYFVLTPGAVWVYRHRNDVLRIEVLDETIEIDGVVTRVVLEREMEQGQLKEISRNFFAIDPQTGDAYYFGEDVDIYEDGRVVSHEGAWRSGVDGARFGLFMPGDPAPGDRFHQELAPGVAMDRAEVVNIGERIWTIWGGFYDCLQLHESTPLSTSTSVKWFAPGVGLVRDDEFVLERFRIPGGVRRADAPIREAP